VVDTQQRKRNTKSCADGEGAFHSVMVCGGMWIGGTGTCGHKLQLRVHVVHY